MQQIEMDVSKHDEPQYPYAQDDGVAEALGSGVEDILLVVREINATLLVLHSESGLK